MTKVVFIVLTVLCATLVRSAEPARPQTPSATGLVTRAYDLAPTPTLNERIEAANDETNRVHASAESAEAKQAELKDFFSQFGMTWPEGSFVRQIGAMGKIVVRNTPENLVIFEGIMGVHDWTVSQMDIEVQFVEFALSDIEVLAKKGPVEADALVQLRRAGKGKLLYAPKVLTPSGREGTIRGVTEYIYPTEFVSYGGGNSNRSVAASALPVAEPSCFETREVGIILQLLPEVAADGSMVNLTLTLQVVYEPTWHDYGATGSTGSSTQQGGNMPMPFFFTQMLTQSISMYNGATVLVGGGLPSRDNDKVVYVFVSVQQVDLEGKPLRRREIATTEEGGKP